MSTLLSKYNSFVKTISDEPYYYIVASPEEANGQVVSTEDQRIWDILYNPPYKRWAGFGVTGLLNREVFQTKEVISGHNVTGGRITLQKDGYFEVQCPIYRQFQRGWGSPQFAIPNSVKWLYPYVVIEFPVSFMRLMKAIYEEVGIASDIFIQQSYHNISGYVLPEGPPTYPTFGAFIDERGSYERTTPIHSEQRVCSDFIPDHVASCLAMQLF